MSTILCIDDDPAIRRLLERTLVDAGHRVTLFERPGSAYPVIAQGDVDLVISDHELPGMTGLELLLLLQQERVAVPVIMLTGHGSIEHAVAAMRAGAVDYLTKPFDTDQLLHVVDRALELMRLRRENQALRRELGRTRPEGVVLGDSPAMRATLEAIAMAAPTRATVLLQGESGTGKELLARRIHEQSGREHGPFIKLNCAALPEGLIESALFGHERGAFTGAVRRNEGAFERADGGTLLLDEISEMRLELQARLLRVLQEQEFERVGGADTIRVDVRVIATTNRDLAAEAAAGRFREDLYFRLSVFPVYVPPLRERGDDISLLAQRFAVRSAAEVGKHVEGLSPEAIASLRAYPWPGNVRELEHAVERAVILSRGPTLGAELFRELLSRRGGLSARATPAEGGASLGGATSDVDVGPGAEPLDLAELERRAIARALRITNQNRTRAAELLGISVRTLRNKLNAGTNEPGPDASHEG